MSTGRVAEFVLAATDYVRRSIHAELDGSPESLAFVDYYVAQAGNPTRELVNLLAPALGSYFGEVVLAHMRGEWQADSEDPRVWTVTLTGPEGEPLLTFHPLGMAAEAVQSGSVDDYDGSIVPIPEFADGFADALARLPPVEANYYYSLTGRFETLEHCVDLLVALRRAGQS